MGRSATFNNSSVTSGYVAFYVKNFKGGGVQKMVTIIANAFADRGYRVDLLVRNPEGPVRAQISQKVNLIIIPPSHPINGRLLALLADPGGFGVMWRPILFARKASAIVSHLLGLVRYLREQHPDVLYTATPFLNIESALACRHTGVNTRLIVSEHNDLSSGHPFGLGWYERHLPPLSRRLYQQAAAIVAVSRGVTENLARRTGLPRERIITIYNAVVTPDLEEKAREPLDHSWFAPNSPPVILSVGRLGKAKDFLTLIRALAEVKQSRPAHLIILGEAANPKRSAKRQAELYRLAEELGVRDDVRLEGYVANPFPYMRHAAVFALSSLYEGFGNVLVEAMACGCPVVSTDCRSGPAEILDHGTYGPLVPVGDHRALAEAILQVIDSPPDAQQLRVRARVFSVDRAVDRLHHLIQEVASRPKPMPNEPKPL